MFPVTHEVGKVTDCLSNGIYRIWVRPPAQWETLMPAHHDSEKLNWSAVPYSVSLLSTAVNMIICSISTTNKYSHSEVRLDQILLFTTKKSMSRCCSVMLQALSISRSAGSQVICRVNFFHPSSMADMPSQHSVFLPTCCRLKTA